MKNTDIASLRKEAAKEYRRFIKDYEKQGHLVFGNYLDVRPYRERFLDCDIQSVVLEVYSKICDYIKEHSKGDYDVTYNLDMILVQKV